MPPPETGTTTMTRARFDWYAADIALAHARTAVFAAIRHRNYRKRTLVLADIDRALYELQKVQRALAQPEAVGAVARSPRESTT